MSRLNNLRTKRGETSIGGTNIVCGNSILPPLCCAASHEWADAANLPAEIVRACGINHRPEFKKPKRHFSTETDKSIKFQKQSPTVSITGVTWSLHVCQPVIFLLGSLYCMSFSLRVHNKVVNGGEKLHFTLRLSPNPPNPSSFYASQEPILPWPSVTHSHICSNVSLPLCLSLCLKLKSKLFRLLL